MIHTRLAFVIFLFVAVAVTTAFTTTAAEITRERSDDWPMFHHDPQRTGYTTSDAPGIGNVLWEFRTGDIVISAPAIVGGRVFVGSNDGTFYCLHENTGELIWSYQTGGIIHSSPAVAGNKVFFGSWDKKVYCLDYNDGKLIWSYLTNDRVDLSSPAVANGKVFIGSDDGKVYCLNENTGENLWSYPTGWCVFSSPAVVNGKVFVGSRDHKIYCLNENTGELIWRYNAGHEVWSSPTVIDSKVFFGAIFKRGIYCLDENTGDLLWRNTTVGTVQESPAVVGSKVFASDSDVFGRLYCLNKDNGEVIWHYGDNIYEIYTSPVVADGRVFIGYSSSVAYESPSFGATVSCVDENTGKLVWNRGVGGIPREISIANGKLFVGCNDSKIYCLGTPLPTITQLTRGQEVFGALTLSGVVLGDKVQGVKISYSENEWISTSLTYKCENKGSVARYQNNWSYSWDTRKIPDGIYTLRVRVDYGSGIYSESATTVRVNNLGKEIEKLQLMVLTAIALSMAAFGLACVILWIQIKKLPKIKSRRHRAKQWVKRKRQRRR